MHVIAGKAVAFKEALAPEFKVYQEQVVKNAKVFAAALEKRGFRIVSGGTDNHLFMVDLTPKNITGKDAAALLDAVKITVNKNLIPFDPQPPTVTSGVRIGTPAITTRGMKEAQMELVAQLIDEAIMGRNDPAALDKVRAGVAALTKKFPIYAGQM
jgi:glycine hydroxymethyltransferase